MRVYRYVSNLSLLCVLALSCGIGVVGCTSTAQRHVVTPTLAPPPKLSADEMAHQGERVEKSLAPDPMRFGLSPATLAVLTNEAAADMGWKEHFILQEETEGSYTVAISEGTTLGVQRRVSITPTGSGSEVLILPPDEGLSIRIKERVTTYLTEPESPGTAVVPVVRKFSLPFAQVWRASKRTIIDGGFSFQTSDADVGFIETERVSLGKASRSWFSGAGQLARVARPPSVSYNYKTIEWRYRIQATATGKNTTELQVEAVIEATPGPSTLQQLTGGALEVLSVPFGSWISGAATGSSTSRLILPSRGVLEKEFYAGLNKKLSGAKKKTVSKRR
ncbi:MAG: hypothetical protein AB7G75_03970 [Candidatus Binatia bacterium]